MGKSSAIDHVALFLEKNYPCNCDKELDPDCPGEIYEAEALVEIVMEQLAKDD